MRRRPLSVLTLWLVAMVLSACASAPRAPTTPTKPLQYPPAPEAARLVYVKSFAVPEDLEIEKGFFERVIEFFAGAKDAHLVRPMAVLVQNGTLYVADPGARGVHRFDLKNHRYLLIQRENDEPLLSPVALAATNDGEVLIVDSMLDQVFAIGPDAKFAQPVTLKVALEQPTGIAVDPANGFRYVVDTNAHAVKVFRPDGALANSFGRRGGGDGEFNYPTMIWRDSNNEYWVTDSLNFRIQRFDATGRFLGRFGRLGDASGMMSRPKGVATDRAGHVYVVDSLFHALQVFDTKGQLLLYVGGQGRDFGEFWLPTGIFIDRDDTIYVADSHNRRVQVFRYVGAVP